MSGGARAFETSSERETMALGERLARVLRPCDVLALEGDLGAGKTRFVRGLARGLGHDERLVSSPTYVLAHEYATNRGAPALVHVDAYRVRSMDELDGLGLDRALRAGAVLAVEWASLLGDALDAARLTVHLEHAGDERRTIRMSWDGAGEGWAGRVASL